MYMQKLLGSRTLSLPRTLGTLLRVYQKYYAMHLAVFYLVLPKLTREPLEVQVNTVMDILADYAKARVLELNF